VDSQLATLETYYDTVPRATASAVDTGPFTLFVAEPDVGHAFYARPRLGLGSRVAREDVDRLREHQRRLDLPETLEWVHETTPTLLAAARASGLEVEECPLLVLAGSTIEAPSADVRLLGPDDDHATAHGAVHAAFGGTDEVRPASVGRRPEQVRQGLLVVVAAYDDRGTVVGGGSHSPRGTTTELTGIGVLPRARRRGVGAAVTAALTADALARGVSTIFLTAQDDAVARVYERVGFARVGTACIAAAPQP
jgi:ribosomal protein S18 acetylase RimI-like enzyme